MGLESPNCPEAASKLPKLSMGYVCDLLALNLHHDSMIMVQGIPIDQTKDEELRIIAHQVDVIKGEEGLSDNQEAKWLTLEEMKSAAESPQGSHLHKAYLKLKQKVCSVDQSGKCNGYQDVFNSTQDYIRTRFPKVFKQYERKFGFSKQVKKDPVVLSLKLDDPRKSDFRMLTLDGFNPKTIPGQRIDLRGRNLAGLIYYLSPDKNIGIELTQDDPTTKTNEAIANLAELIKTKILPFYPNLLTRLGIKDLSHLTPREAVSLATHLTMRIMNYSKKQANGPDARENMMESEFNRTAPVEVLLEWQHESDGNGMCENYAEVATGVLNALKFMQTQENSLIHNTYGLSLPAYVFDSPGNVFGNAWNGFVTVTNGGVDAVVIDTTWGDINADGTGFHEIDYTEDRFLVLAELFEQFGLIKSSNYTSQLWAKYKDLPKPHFPKIDKTNYGWHAFKIYPKRYLISSKLLIELSKTGDVPTANKEDLKYFLDTFLSDLEAHTSQVTQASKHLNKENKYLYGDILYPVLTNIKLIATIVGKNEMGSDNEKKIILRLRKVFDKLFQRFEKVMMDEFVDIYLLEMIGRTDLSDRLIDTQTNRYSTSLRHITAKAYSILPPDRKAKYEKLFQISQSGSRDVMERKWVCELFHYMPADPEDAKYDARTPNSFLGKLYRVLKNNKFDTRELSRLELNIDNWDMDSYSPGWLLLNPEMTEKEIAKKIEETVKLEREWNEIQNRLPTRLAYGAYMGDPEAITERELRLLMSRVDRMLSSTDEHLIRGRNIMISRYARTIPKEMNRMEILRISDTQLPTKLFFENDSAGLKKALADGHRKIDYTRFIKELRLKKKFHNLSISLSEIDGIDVMYVHPFSSEQMASLRKLYNLLDRVLPRIVKKYPKLKKKPIPITIDTFAERKQGLNKNGSLVISPAITKNELEALFDKVYGLD